MTITINFSVEARDWIAHNLSRGLPAYSVARELAANKVDPDLAVAMTAAVRRALVSGAPLPNDSLTVDPSGLEYLPMPSAVPDQSRLTLDDRTVFVAMRLTRPTVFYFPTS